MWRKIQRFLGTILPAFLVALLLAVGICMLNRWDAMVPVTLIPIWAWATFAVGLAFVTWLIARNIFSLVVLCLWLVVGVGFSEETHGLFREVMAAINNQKIEKKGERQICVVNMDCSGSKTSLQKLLDLDPDIALIQQAPDESALLEIADNLWGVERQIVIHGENAILAKGELLNSLVEEGTSTLHARVRHPLGNIIDITNLELEKCAPSLDIWKPQVWEDLIEARETNRRMVRSYLGENEITDASTGRIVGGKFNTPPGDDVFRPLISADLIDTYSVAGLGLGNTSPSDYAILRLDQIWVSRNLSPDEAVTRRNTESDRRIVVTYLTLPTP